MLIRRAAGIPSSEITSEALYSDRRRFLGVAAGVGLAAAAGIVVPALGRGRGVMGALAGWRGAPDDDPTSYEDVTSYNNFYEFGTGKDDPKKHGGSLRTRPWTVRVDGEVARPANYALDDLVKPFAV